MQGRHFGFLASLCAVWITARVGFLSILGPAGTIGRIEEVLPELPTRPRVVAAARQNWTPHPAASHLPAPRVFGRFANLQSSGAILPESVRPLQIDGRLRPDGPPQGLAQPSIMAAAARASEASPLAVYAYSFVRASNPRGAPLGSGQYGGSQSGIIAAYALSRRGDTDQVELALLLRSAIAHEDIAEREVATGLRWHPVSGVPFSLTAERRFRNARTDAFAAYVAGGLSEAKLPLDFRLDAYAQAGFVTRKDGGAFFDASARAERRTGDIGGVPIRAGAGLWAGGQEGIFRIDAGPTISGQIPVADARLRISADWRFRIAGDAGPASGPALTLSTAF